MSKYTFLFSFFIKKILIKTWIEELVKFEKNASFRRV